MIDEQFRLEILDWIAEDPDSETASLLSKWLADNNEVELRKSFNGFLDEIFFSNNFTRHLNGDKQTSKFVFFYKK